MIIKVKLKEKLPNIKALYLIIFTFNLIVNNMQYSNLIFRNHKK